MARLAAVSTHGNLDERIAQLMHCKPSSKPKDIAKFSQARFWELVSGHVVESISLQMKDGMDIIQHSSTSMSSRP